MGYYKIEPGMDRTGTRHPNRIFQKPEELWDAFREYVDHIKEQSMAGEWKKTHFVGKDGLEKYEYVELPLTLSGFKSYYYKKHKRNLIVYFQNQNGYHDDFKEVCQMIREEIRDKQIVGGLTGHYNASITARLNNLHDNQNVNHNGIESIEIKVVN